jgi:hypothetical protein
LNNILKDKPKTYNDKEMAIRTLVERYEEFEDLVFLSIVEKIYGWRFD